MNDESTRKRYIQTKIVNSFHGVNNLARRDMITQERHEKLMKQREEMLEKLAEKERIKSFDLTE